MTRLSPAVGRIISILNFFVEHPQQAFTLTQVVKSLHLSRATCHALLASLVEAGYLYRTPDKSYVLGPGLIALAVNAQQHFSPMAVARQELRILADELDLVAAALFREGDEIVLRERAASLSHLGWVTGTGQRHSLHPHGLYFFALLSPDELKGELERVKPPVSEQVREDVGRQAQFVRSHGFIMGVQGQDASWSDALGTVWASGARFVNELDLDQEYRLRFLVSPVYDSAGKVVFGISLYGFTHPLKGAEVARVGERLHESCRRITAFITGPNPHFVV